MEEKVKDILSKQLRIPVSEITSESNIMEDLGADSIDVVEMLMSIEESLEISIPDEEITSLKTVRDITEYLENNYQS